VNKLLDKEKKINQNLMIPGVELKEYTTFKVGGQGEFFLQPRNLDQLKEALSWVKAHNLPLTVLGSGANVVISDKGIPGAVLYTGYLKSIEIIDQLAVIQGGAEISRVIEELSHFGLSGLENFYGMPSSLGGALRMNARCYGSDISDNLLWVDYFDPKGVLRRYTYSPDHWEYKVSPFQQNDLIIYEAAFRLIKKPMSHITDIMKERYEDRESKGHFKAPCAGSVFKNNRKYGAPSGKIIDEQGLRGLSIGGAKVSDWHANIIINTGTATASNIRDLVLLVQSKVRESTGFELEPEILFLGDWD